MYWKVSVGLSVMFRTPRIDSLWNLTPSWAAPSFCFKARLSAKLLILK